MAGEGAQEVSGISLGLGLDTSGWSEGIDRAKAELRGLAESAQNVSVRVARAQAPKGSVAAADLSPRVSPAFNVTQHNVRDMRAAINAQLRAHAQQGEAVGVPIKLGRIPWGALRSEIAAGIGEVPIRVSLASVSPQSRNIIQAMMSVSTGSSMGKAQSQIESAAASRGIPKRAMGGPAYGPVVVGDAGRAEVYVPSRPGRIEPSAAEWRRREMDLRRRELETARIEGQRREYVGHPGSGYNYGGGGRIARHRARGGPAGTTDLLRYPQEVMEGNIARVAEQMTPQERQFGRIWYPLARRQILHGAEAEGYLSRGSLGAAANRNEATNRILAMGAGASPNMQWFANLAHSRAIARAGVAGGRPTKEMADSMLPWVRRMLGPHAKVSQGVMGLAGRELDRIMAIMGGMAPEEAFAGLPKVLPFSQNLRGDMTKLTLDSIAAQIATSGLDKWVKGAGYAKAPSEGVFRDAMEQAYKNVYEGGNWERHFPKGIGQFQAATWTKYRGQAFAKGGFMFASGMRPDLGELSTAHDSFGLRQNEPRLRYMDEWAAQALAGAGYPVHPRPIHSLGGYLGSVEPSNRYQFRTDRASPAQARQMAALLGRQGLRPGQQQDATIWAAIGRKAMHQMGVGTNAAEYSFRLPGPTGTGPQSRVGIYEHARQAIMGALPEDSPIGGWTAAGGELSILVRNKIARQMGRGFSAQMRSVHAALQGAFGDVPLHVNPAHAEVLERPGQAGYMQPEGSYADVSRTAAYRRAYATMRHRVAGTPTGYGGYRSWGASARGVGATQMFTRETHPDLSVTERLALRAQWQEQEAARQRLDAFKQRRALMRERRLEFEPREKRKAGLPKGYQIRFSTEWSDYPDPARFLRGPQLPVEAHESIREPELVTSRHANLRSYLQTSAPDASVYPARGYRAMTATPSMPGIVGYVLDRQGNMVANTIMTHRHELADVGKKAARDATGLVRELDALHPEFSWTSPEHQGKGLMTALYHRMERFTGMPIAPSSEQTPFGRALWSKDPRNRPFGKPFKQRRLSAEDRDEIEQILEATKAGTSTAHSMGWRWHLRFEDQPHATGPDPMAGPKPQRPSRGQLRMFRNFAAGGALDQWGRYSLAAGQPKGDDSPAAKAARKAIERALGLGKRAGGGAVGEIERLFPNAAVRLDRFSHRALDEIAGIAGPLASRYPATAHNMRAVAFDPVTERSGNNTLIARLRASPWDVMPGMSGKGVSTGSRMLFQNRAARIGPDLRHLLDRQLVGGSGLASTFAHEFGHAVDYTHGTRPRYLTQKFDMGMLSRYASEGPLSEAFAELFGALETGNPAGIPFRRKAMPVLDSMSEAERRLMGSGEPFGSWYGDRGYRRAGGTAVSPWVRRAMENPSGRTLWGGLPAKETSPYGPGDRGGQPVIAGEIGRELYVPRHLEGAIPDEVFRQLPKRARGTATDAVDIAGLGGMGSMLLRKNAISMRQLGYLYGYGRPEAGKPILSLPWMQDEATTQKVAQQMTYAPHLGRERRMAGGGMLEIDPGEHLWTPPGDGWIIPNRLMNKVPRRADGSPTIPESPPLERAIIERLLKPRPEGVSVADRARSIRRHLGPLQRAAETAAMPRAYERAPSAATYRPTTLEPGVRAEMVESRINAAGMRGLTARSALAGIFQFALGGKERRVATEEFKQLNLELGDWGKKLKTDNPVSALQGSYEHAQGMVASYSKEVDKLARRHGASSVEARNAGTALEGWRRSEHELAQDLAHVSDLTARRTLAEQKMKVTTGDLVGNFGASLLAGSAFSVGMQAVQVGLSAAGEALKPFADQVGGFGATTTRVSKDLGDSVTQMGGNVKAALGKAAAGAGLGTAGMAFVGGALTGGATAAAAGTASGQAMDLRRAAFGASRGNAPTGLYGGYGGLLGSSFLGGMLGGGKGFLENIAGEAQGYRAQMVTPAGGGTTAWGTKATKAPSLTPAQVASNAQAMAPLVAEFRDYNEAVQRGSRYLGENASSLKLLTKEQVVAKQGMTGWNDASKKVAAMAAQIGGTAPDEVGKLLRAGGVLVDESGKAITDAKELTKYLSQAAQGTILPSKEAFAQQQAQALTGQQQGADLQRWIQQQVLIPGQLGQQLAAQPLMPAQTGIASTAQWKSIGFGGGAADMKSVADSVAETQRMQSETTATAHKALLGQADFIRSNITQYTPTDISGTLPTQTGLLNALSKTGAGPAASLLSSPRGVVAGTGPGLLDMLKTGTGGAAMSAGTTGQVKLTGTTAGEAAAGEYLKLYGDVNDVLKESAPTIYAYGNAIRDLNTRVANRQVTASVHQQAEAMRVMNRSITYAQGLVSGQGATTGAGANLGAVERRQFELGTQSQQLQLGLSQRQINFQTAVAGFQAPGITGAERAARMEEAQIEARYAQKQLNIQKQQLPLGVTAFNVGAQNQLTDLQHQKQIASETFSVQQRTLADQKRISDLQVRQQQLVNRAEGITSQAQQGFGGTLSSATDYVVNFGDSIKAATNALRKALGLPALNETHAAGVVGDYLGPTTMTVGEAGKEHVAVLRNPRRASLGAYGLGGGSSAGGPTIVNVSITGNTISSEMDLSRIVTRVQAAVEDGLGRKARLLQASPSSY